MRLSLMKAAHVVVSGAAWHEIRVRSGRDDNFLVGRDSTFPGEVRGTADPSAPLDCINRKAPVAPALDFGLETEAYAREQRSLMKIVGCDFHPSYQQIAVLDTEPGRC